MLWFAIVDERENQDCHPLNHVFPDSSPREYNIISVDLRET